ncbi:MAG: hypothetical protein RIR65_536 [Planctomycetota bacterium]
MNLFGGFVNPALLAGLAAAGVPIAIHLLNRRRHRPQPWAAMRFVEAAWRKTRRRVQFEEWLLLFLRTAAVFLFALALARPFTGEESPLAGLSEARRDLVVVVDASASMGQQAGGRSAFEAALERARELVRGADAARGDRVRILAAAGAPRLLSWTTPEQARGVLDGLPRPEDEELDLAAALNEIAELARADASSAATTIDLRLLTDLQERAYLRGSDEGAGQGLYEVLDELKELGVEVVVEDMARVETVPPNLSVESIAPLERPTTPDAPVELRASLRNHGEKDARGVRVAFVVDGERRPQQLVDVPARGAAEAACTISFGSAGAHLVEVRIEAGDNLAVDDQRAVVVDVPGAVRLLLVNGARGARLEEDELGYAKTVLAPLAVEGELAARAPFEVREIEPFDLGGADIDFSKFDVVWLAACDAPAPSVAAKLATAVESGLSLVVSAGDRVDARAWNQRMGAEGARLLPVELGEFRGERTRDARWRRPKSFDARHPALQFFGDERFAPLFAEIPVYGWIGSRPLEGARVLASLDDDAASPLFVERDFGRGRVWWWATTIGPGWTRLPESPATLVPLVHEWMREAGSTTPPPLSIAPGSAWRGSTAQFPRGARVVTPDGARRPLEGEARQQGGRWLLPAVPAAWTTRVGAYKVELENQPALSFAVGLAAGEGDLKRILPDALSNLHPALVPAEGAAAEQGEEQEATRQGELWRALVLAVLAALVVESLWAGWIGHRRSA